MHSRIFQIEHNPVDPEDRICEDSIPEWFTSSVADYVSDIKEERRDEDIEWLMNSDLGKVCKRDGDKITFSIDVSAFFEDDFQKFKNTLEGLTNVTLAEFAGGKPPNIKYDQSLHHLMFLLNDAYDDKYGFYVWSEEELWTMNEWMRRIDPCSVYYIGGVVDYHF